MTLRVLSTSGKLLIQEGVSKEQMDWPSVSRFEDMSLRSVQ